jgi:hypothetical protein
MNVSEGDNPHEFARRATVKENSSLPIATAIKLVSEEEKQIVVIGHDRANSPTFLKGCSGDKVIHADLGPSNDGDVLVVTCHCGNKYRIPKDLLNDEILGVLGLGSFPDI